MADTSAVRRRPGPARSLSRQQVIAVGLEVMARDGLKSVSFRTIAMRLGVDHKALYTYVADKDDLLSGMFEATLANLELPRPDDPRPPEDQLVDLLVSLRTSLIANLDLLQLVGQKLTFGVEQAAEGIWAALLAIVPDVDRAAELLTSLVQLTIGSAFDTVRYNAFDTVRTTVLAQVDLEGHGNLAAYARAITEVDRAGLFETMLRTLLQQARA